VKFKPAVYALIRLHAETGAKIRENHKQAKRLAADMKAVETVIRILEPGYNTRHMGHRRRLKPNSWFKRGEYYRGALDVLRKAEGALTPREIANRMLAAKGVTGATLMQVRLLTAAIKTSLSKHMGKTVERVGRNSDAMEDSRLVFFRDGLHGFPHSFSGSRCRERWRSSPNGFADDSPRSTPKGGGRSCAMI